MIVTIDGPAGAGKSSVARALARKLGFRFLDTGAMYRAVALAAVSRNLPWDDSQVAQLAADISIEVTDDRVFLDGEDVTGQIRRSEITSVIHHVADNQQVRRHLVGLQRRIAAGSDIVTEGRDQGTVVFPHAECKIFLTASEEERARRRFQDLSARGEEVDFDEVLRKQHLRDQRDVERTFGGLAKAKDSIEVLTDGMTPEQVVDALEQLVRSAQNK